MGHLIPRRLAAICLAMTLVWPAAGLEAGTKVKIKGDVEEVSEQVEDAFRELDIDPQDSAVSEQYARKVGESKSGSRVTVAVSRSGDEECEVTISSESPADPDIEERFLRMMQTR